MKRCFALLCCLSLLLCMSGCAPSPTAVTVNGSRVDASEYAFYLRYNSDRQSEADAVYTDGETEAARALAMEQIVTGEIVRQKCRELGLALSDEQKAALEEEKTALIESLGGKAAYVEYLKESCLTDRAYDKFQESALYYQRLYDHISEETVYTDEALRQFFSDSYITLKYIRFPTVNDYGQPLADNVLEAVRVLAEEVLARAQSGDEDFDLLVQSFGGAYNGSTGAIVSRLEGAGVDYIEMAFLLDPNTTDGVYECADGYYILQRLPVDATYYESNRDYIRQSALDWAFSQQLSAWKADTQVTTAGVVEDITLNNVHDYVK